MAVIIVKRGRPTAAKAGGFRHESDVSTRCYQARMRVSAFVGGDDGGRIAQTSLHPLLYSTSWTSAAVVAPDEKTLILFHEYSLKLEFFIIKWGKEEGTRDWKLSSWNVCVCVYIYLGKGAIFHSFLPVLSPSIPIVEIINLTLCQKCKSRLSFLFGFFLCFNLNRKSRDKQKEIKGLNFLLEKEKIKIKSSCRINGLC